VPDPVAAVREMARVLKPGGRLLLTAPLGSGIHQEPFHYYGGYTPYWYRKFLGEAGFEQIEVEANHGFFRFYSQESIRFLRMSNPFGATITGVMKLFWLPFWLLLLPLLGLFIPLASVVLDRYDKQQFFTIGYHVKARRKQDGS
jgi:SAM-dependent methyltransferase